MLSNHFSKGLCKGSGYTVQIIGKQEGRQRTGREAIRLCIRGAIDLHIVAVLCRKKETELMLKLRNVYLYGLIDKVKDEDQCKEDKECEDLIRKAFPSLPRLRQRDSNASHQKKKVQISLNCKLFINHFEH